MLTLTMPHNAATISIITTVLYAPAQTKRHRGPNSQKNSLRRNRFAMQLMISGNRDVPKRAMRSRRRRRHGMVGFDSASAFAELGVPGGYEVEAV
jgi:hypothetical protein